MITIDDEQLGQLRYHLLRYPRELDGFVVEAIEGALDDFPGLSDPAVFVDQWYRDAGVASYESVDAAAAYLAAYGPRSVLKYIEALLGLISSTRFVDLETVIVDWGAGPNPGLAAALTVWQALREVLGADLRLSYRAAEPSTGMKRVGEAFVDRLLSPTRRWATFAAISPDDQTIRASVLVVANVANEGEGIYEVGRFIEGVLDRGLDVDHIISIEPATPGPSRQMCSLQQVLGTYRHIGPCPSGSGDCSKWVFRTIEKRSYAFERRSLGRWAPAAEAVKYSLALLSRVSDERPACDLVVIGQRGGLLTLCSHGQTRRVRGERELEPWDCASERGVRAGVWP